MKRVLIILEAGKLADQVLADLRRDHNVVLCHSTADAAEFMDPLPDAMALQMDLPGMDGLTYLEHLPQRPAVILAIAAVFSAYSSQRLYELDVGQLVRTPCTVPAITDRLRDMLRPRKDMHCDPQAKAAAHLTILGIPAMDEGGRHLRVGIQLYAQDTSQKLSAELYPAIAKICNTTADTVEHKIRGTIKSAWERRDPESWLEYFPKRKQCPTSKVFISTLAQKLY